MIPRSASPHEKKPPQKDSRVSCCFIIIVIIAPVQISFINFLICRLSEFHQAKGLYPHQKIDEKNLQTPVVIQVASHEEQKEQDSYKSDFDELESPKEYVIDQIFCGENLTIYALFEKSELSGKKSEKHLIEVTESSTNDEFRFYHRSSYKKSLEEKDSNGFQSNCKNSSTGEMATKDTSQMTESFYCLKNHGGRCEVTRGVDDSSDLKVLYSKNQKIGKLKLVSKGVNTDIAQCPKLVDDVRKAISVSKPFTKGDGKTIEIQAFPPVKSSYELIEIETAPSSSSCCSDLEDYRKHSRKSSPNVLLVPLLMMDEGMLNMFKSEDKNQHNKEEKFVSSEKVSLGINTDFSCSEFLGRSNGSDIDQESDIEQTGTKSPNPRKCTGKKCKKSKPNEKKEDNDESESESELTSKKTILKEIKNLQDKLNILIKSLECGESKDSRPKKLSGEITPSVIQLAEQNRQPSVHRLKSTTESKPTKRNQRRYDDLPIFSPVIFNTTSTKPLNSKMRKKPSSAERDRPKESLPIQAKSTISILTSSVSSIFKTPFALNENEVKENLIEQSYRTNFTRNNKTLSVSKSECSVQFRVLTPDLKCPFVAGLRKTLSYELGEEKTDGLGAKKMKYALLKSDGNFKSKNNVRVHSNIENGLPNNITPLNCEMGDEIGKKLKQDVLVAEQNITEDERLLKVLEKEALVVELKKTSQNDEEGDAKISYQTAPFSVPSLAVAPKNGGVVVNYCNTNGDRILKKEKSFKKITGQTRIKSGLSIDIEPKVSGQMEKPTTPIKNDRKLNTEANPRKELKSSNLNKSKIPDKINKNVKKETGQSEPGKFRSLTCNRPKFSGESKLHVDKLIKKTPANTNEITSHKTHPKSEKEEKLSGKSDQHYSPKTTPQNRDRRERETVSNHNETCDLVQSQTVYSNHSHTIPQIKTEGRYFQKHDFRDKTLPEDKPQAINLLTDSSSGEGNSENLPSVIVELFSKKQGSIADSHTEFDLDCTTGPDTDTSHVGLYEKGLMADAEDTDGILESGVKSVWALTKVLLYGDGTKKFEVLEVSLTPPECSLNNEKLNDQKNG